MAFCSMKHLAGVDLSNISLSDVESIEIYRGISPANFGKASIGGVVNIKTLRSMYHLKIQFLIIHLL